MSLQQIMEHQLDNSTLSNTMYSLMSPAVLLGSLFFSFLAAANSSIPQVTLQGYGSFAGTNISKTLLGDNLPQPVNA